jgi:very-short-patch-repair endonuclease
LCQYVLRPPIAQERVHLIGDTRVGADARRDRKLARMVYRVLRLDADLVRRDVHAAVEQIRTALR